MLAYLYCYYLPVLDSNDTECTEEGEVFEYQEEEDQGQAIKASHLLESYLNPITALCIILLLLLLLCIVFLILLIIPSWQ
jgi:hypothetical protein